MRLEPGQLSDDGRLFRCAQCAGHWPDFLLILDEGERVCRNCAGLRERARGRTSPGPTDALAAAEGREG
jgi:hypothetical protein